MAVLDIIEEAVIRWTLRFVYTVQVSCYVLILLVLVPFLGLYIIDAWLYMVRLTKYYYKLRQYNQRRYPLEEKIEQDESISMVESPVIRKNQNTQRIIKRKDMSMNIPLSTSLQTLMDKIQEYLVVSHQQDQKQTESVLRSRDDLIYIVSSNDSMTHTDSNELSRLHRMVSA
ncbi:similar to Saccharomyces cerevisiae YDR275W (ohnolog of YOR044W IRC23) BSC2 Protein of unknown function [Maudiozyma saulgeensis]|uniref:Uncharacterized protein n=1 Tax=Maudiozyma saulgeensis TaxID=1789683 RepID=A0A1X7QWQ0_9SACH|nr:similar to Saccharomyces cerevisiae YDR275W (ohnolog of YOR044W IRC23) BSC2 Protein of unknown function [Kazachstania saulgeensis]